MKKIGELLYIVTVSMLIPWIIISGAVAWKGHHHVMSEGKSLRLMTGSGIESIGFQDYLTGVLLAEIPSDFPEEAVKAQAVASRTYTRKRMEKPKHIQADICTDSTCCQGYCQESDYISKGGKPEFVQLCRRAVQQTENEVMVYNNCLIDAAYFASTGGYTEASAAVWGAECPYLIAQPSPEENLEREYVFSQEQICSSLDIPFDKALVPEILKRTEGNGVEIVQIGGVSFSGLQLRQKLGLCSTDFDIIQTEDCFIIRTHGNGHRVGMSQYGACTMAKDGKNYREILAYYYPGTEFTILSLQSDNEFDTIQSDK